MGAQAEKWVLMVTARTPTNIAVIKYWGKRDEKLILPINDSISVTLDPNHLCTTTTVSVSPSFVEDRMWLNGKVHLNLISLCLSIDQLKIKQSEMRILNSVIGLSPLKIRSSLRFR